MQFEKPRPYNDKSGKPVLMLVRVRELHSPFYLLTDPENPAALIGVINDGGNYIVPKYKHLRDEFSKCGLNKPTVLSNDTDIYVLLETAFKPVKQQQEARNCMHLDASVTGRNAANCPRCGSIQPRLVFANLALRLTELNEKVWEDDFKAQRGEAKDTPVVE